jgi:hypothetical protein
VKPVVVITDRLVPRAADAMTVWPVIFVRLASRDDKGLIEHELVHWHEQAWNPLWWVRYLLSSSFRQAAEVRAYRRQIDVRGISIEQAADYLARDYGLPLTNAQARELLAAAGAVQTLATTGEG